MLKAARGRATIDYALLAQLYLVRGSEQEPGVDRELAKPLNAAMLRNDAVGKGAEV